MPHPSCSSCHVDFLGASGSLPGPHMTACAQRCPCSPPPLKTCGSKTSSQRRCKRVRALAFVAGAVGLRTWGHPGTLTPGACLVGMAGSLHAQCRASDRSAGMHPARHCPSCRAARRHRREAGGRGAAVQSVPAERGLPPLPCRLAWLMHLCRSPARVLAACCCSSSCRWIPVPCNSEEGALPLARPPHPQAHTIPWLLPLPCLQEDPLSASAHSNLGNVHQQQGKAALAVQDFSKAVELAPQVGGLLPVQGGVASAGGRACAER